MPTGASSVTRDEVSTPHSLRLNSGGRRLQARGGPRLLVAPTRARAASVSLLTQAIRCNSCQRYDSKPGSSISGSPRTHVQVNWHGSTSRSTPVPVPRSTDGNLGPGQHLQGMDTIWDVAIRDINRSCLWKSAQLT